MDTHGFDSHKGPAIKKFRKCDPEFLQWRQPCGELMKSTVRALAGSHLYLSEVSMPSKGTEEIEEIKKISSAGTERGCLSHKNKPALYSTE